jgi:hypothetical protein
MGRRYIARIGVVHSVGRPDELTIEDRRHRIVRIARVRRALMSSLHLQLNSFSAGSLQKNGAASRSEEFLAVIL